MYKDKKVGLAAVGDVLDINCWSNIPFYLFKAGRKASLFDEPWSLDMSKFTVSRIAWNARQLLLGKGKGGYQYSKDFLDKAERYYKEVIDFPLWKNPTDWNNLKTLVSLRNVIAHENGRFDTNVETNNEKNDEKNDEKKRLQIREKIELLEKQGIHISCGFLVVKNEFKNKIFESVDRQLRELINRYEECYDKKK